MEFSDFLKNLLGIGIDFEVSKSETDEIKNEINIHIRYLPKRVRINEVDFPVYDHAPERKWQH